MAISIKQAVGFCQVFGKLADHGKFNKIQDLKKLSQSDRRICLRALTVIENAQLQSWVSKSAAGSKKLIDNKRLEEITKRIMTKPAAELTKKVRWYQTPFLWIARSVNSLFLGFQNTFMGRVSSKVLIDKVASYCQESGNAPSKIEEIEKDILPEVSSEIQKKLKERDQEILKQKLASEWLPPPPLLLAIKSESKQESILSEFISFSHVDSIPDQPFNPFYKIIHDLLTPYFKEDSEQNFSLTPYHELHASALVVNKQKISLQEAQDQLESLANEVKIAKQKLEESQMALSKAEEGRANQKKQQQKVFLQIKAIKDLVKESPEIIGMEDAVQGIEGVQAITSKVAELHKLLQEFEAIKVLIDKAAKECEELKSNHEERAKVLEEKRKSFHSSAKNLQLKEKEFKALCQDLKGKYAALTGAIRPFVISDLSKVVKTHLSELYNSAAQALKLSESYDKAKELANTSKDQEHQQEYAKSSQLLRQQIILVNNLFNKTFMLIEENINQHGKRLDAIKNGVGVLRGDTSKRLTISKLPFYGLQSLLNYRQTLINDVALLKLKYNL